MKYFSRDTFSKVAMFATLASCATFATFTITASEAEACSPPPPYLEVDYITEDGTTVTRQPSFLFRTTDYTPIAPEKFTLSDAQGANYLVETELVTNSFFSDYYSVRAKTQLPAGSYTLTYETEDMSVAPDPNQPPPTYKSILTFTIDAATSHTGQLELGLDWTQIHPGPNDPVFQDSCGGSNAESNKLEISFAGACRSTPFGLYYMIEFLDDQGNILYSRTKSADATTLDNEADPNSIHTTTWQGETEGSAMASCVRVTPYTTSGVAGETVELCSPTRCGTAPSFDPNNTYTDCPNSANQTTQIVLPDPYQEASCMIATGFDPCDGVMCGENQVCDQGQCVEVDACANVRCEGGTQCVDGECVEIDPCADMVCEGNQMCVDGVCELIDMCANVSCQDGETCVEGVCEADEVDPCDGVMCAEGEACVEGVCESTSVEPDACDGVVCGADQICHQGKCYAEVVANNMTPGNNNTPTNNNTPGNNSTPNDTTPTTQGNNNNGAEEDGCQTTHSGAPAQGAPLLALGLLGLIGLIRRERSK